MDNALLLLKRVSASWLSPGPTTWLVDLLLALVCGLGLFLLLLPCLQGGPEPPPAPSPKKNSRKVSALGPHPAARHSFSCVMMSTFPS